jgi:hypothetical protein
MSQEPAPPPIDDPVLGRLEWDDEFTLLGEIEYRPGERVPFLLGTDEGWASTIDVVAQAALALERFRQNERHYRLWTAGELNKTRRNVEVEMADADIANMLLIESFVFDETGEMTVFWNDDGQLYGWHEFVTVIAPDGECLRAGLL